LPKQPDLTPEFI